MKLTITVDDQSSSVDLTDSQAAGLLFSTNVFNGQSGTATPADFLVQEVVNDTNAWAAQRLQLRLNAVPQRLTEMPADKIAEAEVIFQIPPTYPNGKDPLPPYVPPTA